MEKVSVIIPVYNSEGTIGTVVDVLKTTMEGRMDFEIILVDDYSRDNSADVCRTLAKEHHFVKFVRLNRNFGQHNAKMAGLHFITGDYVVCLDDDLQNPPELIFRLIDEIRKGYDVVYSYSTNKEQALWKNLGSKANDLMARWLLGKPKWLKFSSYQIFTRLIAEEIKKYSGAFPYLSGTILQATTNIGQVHIEHRKRTEGRSNYSLWTLFSLWLNGFTSFSIAPLRAASVFGVLFCLLSMVATAFLIIRKILYPATILGGWTSIAVLILFVSGAQFLFLGLVGEYVGRVLLWVNGKPQFVVRETVNVESNEQKEQTHES